MTALSILVVEDDAMIGMLLGEMLEEMGYDVCAIAATEEDAVEAAARFRPGLMIVDEHLREGSGVSAVERIRRNGPVACVFISGEAKHLGRPGVNVLQKPFLEEDLARAIQHVIGGAEVAAQSRPMGSQSVPGP